MVESGESMSGIGPDVIGICVRAVRVVCVLVVVGFAFVLMPVALANASSLTWVGGSPGRTESAAYWSVGANWEGGIPPVTSQDIETLTFPHLTNSECAAKSPTYTCYLTLNDVGGMSAKSMVLDDADDYLLDGEGIVLGSGGITASPETSGPAVDFILMPFQLSEPQKWKIADRSGGAIEEDGLLLDREVTGSSALTTELSYGSTLVLDNDTEVGRVTIEGPVVTGSHIKENGSVFLEGGELDSADQEPVDLRNVYFAGAGAVGALTVENSTITVGNDAQPAGGIASSSVALDSDSGAIFQITGSGTTAQVDYSQLASNGPVSLNGSSANVVVVPVAGRCPELVTGQTYTFISTTGGLSGSFGNAGEGAELPLTYAEGCAQQASKHLQIAYYERGGTQTVTAKVVETDVNSYNPYVRAEASVEWGAIAGARAGAEYQAERHAAEAAAKERQAREEAERKALIERQDAASMLASSLTSNITVQRDGAALVELDCTGSATGQSCVGKLNLSVQARPKSGKRSHTVTVTIATAQFSIVADKTATVHVDLNGVGRALLRADHGRLGAHLTILQSAPAAHTQIRGVRLVGQPSHGKKIV